MEAKPDLAITDIRGHVFISDLLRGGVGHILGANLKDPPLCFKKGICAIIVVVLLWSGVDSKAKSH